VIHRAPLGSHERFTAFLIEHYAGAFPVWLAPIQARIIPITDRVADYALKVRDRLLGLPVVNGTAGLRVDIDLSAERMQRKIRDAQMMKIPYMLVIGDKEAQTDAVSVRLRSGRDLGAIPLDTFLQRIGQEAESRHDMPD
ncbi:MAG: His/Gly/Thr/Pro-type tRNA ligase C-terminal domain-containing protein, partial [Vulcanimicrobiaceae bacterium]